MLQLKLDLPYTAGCGPAWLVDNIKTPDVGNMYYVFIRGQRGVAL